MAYVIGTGYYQQGNNYQANTFFQLWLNNTKRYSTPVDIVVVNAAASPVEAAGVTWLNMKHNYGHVSSMPANELFCGWWLGFMLGAWVAYHHKCDFIYKEQDCLAFGPWVEHLYNVLKHEKAGVVVGRFNHRYKIEQSLVLVQRQAIPKLISRYLAIPHTDRALRPELKFLRIMTDDNKFMVYMAMGCGRNRPVPYNDRCFYAQKLTTKELAELSRRKLI
jgi:hypothetical protein